MQENKYLFEYACLPSELSFSLRGKLSKTDRYDVREAQSISTEMERFFACSSHQFLLAENVFACCLISCTCSVFVCSIVLMTVYMCFVGMTRLNLQSVTPYKSRDDLTPLSEK